MASTAPNSTSNSPWPQKSRIHAIAGRANGSSSSSNAYGDGVSTAITASKRHRDDVLDDQNADRDAAVHGPQLAVAFEHLRGKHRAREPERHGEHDGREPREAGAPVDRGRSDHPRREQVQQRGAPDLGPHEGLHAELQSDREQQQQHARMRELAEQRPLLHAERAEHEARCHEADERRQADSPGRETEQQRTRDPDRDHPGTSPVAVNPGHYAEV